MLLGPLTVNCHQPCFEFSATNLRGHDADAEREVHRFATVHDDPGRAGANQATEPALDILKLLLKPRGLSRHGLRSRAG